MPLFSVVTPVYNREGLIQQTLRSIVEQERRDLDVIVVDDGSTDDTLAVINSFADQVRIFQQENKGPGAARNRGIKEARGDYVAFLDSDDLWFPWTLDAYEEIIRTHDEPAFIAGQPYRFSSAEEVSSVERKQIETRCFRDYLAGGDAWRWWSVSSFVMRTDALRRVGGFTERPINGEDADLTMRMGTEPGFVEVVSGPTLAYRQHDEQLMSSVRKNAEGAAYMVEQETENRYPGGRERRLDRWRILSRHVRPASVACVREGLTERGWRLYRDTMQWNWALGRLKYLFGFPLRAAQFSLERSLPL
jgi:glycosyltransferase involved in cell wall biosynthesis